MNPGEQASTVRQSWSMEFYSSKYLHSMFYSWWSTKARSMLKTLSSKNALCFHYFCSSLHLSRTPYTSRLPMLQGPSTTLGTWSMPSMSLAWLYTLSSQDPSGKSPIIHISYYFSVAINSYMVYSTLLCFTCLLQWHYIISVINEMANILGIRVFVPKPVRIILFY